MKYDFTIALINNIERTYTFAYAKNAYQYDGRPESYHSMAFFEKLLEYNPFEALMNLDGFAFKRTKQTIQKYGIPYEPEQERRAKVYADVTDKMMKERSDYVSLHVEDLKNTGIELIREPYVLTTKKTIEVAEFIERLPRNVKTHHVIYENKIPSSLLSSKEQYEALTTCVGQQVSCLIGGAGTGKSYVTANIIKQLVTNGQHVAILAPTHKAREALQSKLEQGTVRTIHSFVHKPEKCDVIVIDESGMLSTPLFHSLMRVYEGQQLIFVGDKNQLPPVEYGRPFEKIQEIFVVAELTDNKRAEAKDIIALGREILGIPQNTNMGHDNIEVVETIQEAFDKGAEVLLTYTNKDVKQTNDEQKVKEGAASISPNFSIGDRIIAKTNEKDRFFNGQLFKIVSYDLVVNELTGKEIRLKSSRDLEYNFDLAYGLTIHKSQGSEWDVVAYKPSSMDTTNLAYVAVTRARKKLIIVGDGLKTEYLPERKWRQLNEVNSI